jgi:histidinol-phosphatase (PHP family)
MSSDGRDSIEDMVGAALAAGLDEYAITDHYDYDYKDPSIDFDLDVEGYCTTLAATAKRCDRDFPGLPGAGRPFRFVKGIELGMQLGEPNLRNLKVVSSCDFDFVVASVHCAWDCAVDIPAYHERRDPETAARDYYDYTLKCLEEYDDFDVLGHINFIDRFTRIVPDEDVVWDSVDSVIKKLVEMGKGMEVNTKIFRVLEGRHSTPTLRMLKRYVELGGETVTTGADAHRVSEVGAGLREAEELMRAAGLRYIASFRNREVKYVPL